MAKIQLAVDHAEGHEFCEWLNARGHEAVIGKTTQTTVDGAPSWQQSDLIIELWATYCEGESW